MACNQLDRQPRLLSGLICRSLKGSIASLSGDVSLRCNALVTRLQAPLTDSAALNDMAGAVALAEAELKGEDEGEDTPLSLLASLEILNLMEETVTSLSHSGQETMVQLLKERCGTCRRAITSLDNLARDVSGKVHDGVKVILESIKQKLGADPRYPAGLLREGMDAVSQVTESVSASLCAAVAGHPLGWVYKRKDGEKALTVVTVPGWADAQESLSMLVAVADRIIELVSANRAILLGSASAASGSPPSPKTPQTKKGAEEEVFALLSSVTGLAAATFADILSQAKLARHTLSLLSKHESVSKGIREGILEQDWVSIRHRLYVVDDMLAEWGKEPVEQDSFDRREVNTLADSPCSTLCRTLSARVSADLELVSTLTPVLTLLRCDALVASHWVQICNALAIPCPASPPARLTVGDIAAAYSPAECKSMSIEVSQSHIPHLTARTKAIRSIVSVALGEREVRKVVEDVAAYINIHCNLTVTPFKLTEASVKRVGPAVKALRDMDIFSHETPPEYTVTCLPFVGGVTRVLSGLAEREAMLQSVKTSPHYATAKNEVTHYEETIGDISRVLHCITKVQRKVAYLEPVMANNALPAQTSPFYRALSVVCTALVTLVSDIEVGGERKGLEREREAPDSRHGAYPATGLLLVPPILLSDLYAHADTDGEGERDGERNVPGALELCESVLKGVERALSEYLDDKRRAFPRFYFVGDQDLLTILSAADPEAVTPHLRKLFGAVAAVTVDGTTKREIVGFSSVDGETIPLQRRIPCRANTRSEVWLPQLAQGISSSLRHSLLTGAKLPPCLPLPPGSVTRGDNGTYFLSKAGLGNASTDPNTLPGEIACLLANVLFCADIEDALVGDGGETGPDPHQECTHRLKWALTSTTKSLAALKNLPCEGDREVFHLKTRILTTTLVHHMSMCRRLIECSTPGERAYQWFREIKYRLVVPAPVASPNASGDLSLGGMDVACVCMGVSYPYFWEYQGLGARIVHSALTDKCIDACMVGMGLGYGGNPYGPAGSGKTETVKYLAGVLGRPVITFNCDAEADVGAIRRVLTGVVLLGAFGCFDEFNRLSERTLHLLANDIKAIQSSIRGGGESTLSLGGRAVHVTRGAAVFVTLNPASREYRGRSQLPDNVKQLLRPVHMARADIDTIAHVALLADGFKTSSHLSTKAMLVCSISGRSLTQSSFVDWGMRGLQTVLKQAAGMLPGAVLSLKKSYKSKPSKEQYSKDVTICEQAVLVQAFRSAVHPRISALDAPVFEGVLRDVFDKNAFVAPPLPSVELKLRHAVEEVMGSLGGVTPEQTDLCLSLYRSLSSKIGVALVGEGRCGKTRVRQALAKAVQSICGLVIRIVEVCPKAVDRRALLGYTDKGEWHDGILTRESRVAAGQAQGVWTWIVCDGDVDPEWVEALNSALDDNHLLTLASGERVRFPQTEDYVSAYMKQHLTTAPVSFLFETDSLQHASPATISRLAVVTVPPLHDKMTRRIRQPVFARGRLWVPPGSTLPVAMGDNGPEPKDKTCALSPNTCPLPSLSGAVPTLRMLLDAGVSTVLSGPRGSGKATLVRQTVSSMQDTIYVEHTCCVDTDASTLVTMLTNSLSKGSAPDGRVVLSPPKGQRLVVYLRDADLPRRDTYGHTPLHCVIRSVVEKGEVGVVAEGEGGDVSVARVSGVVFVLSVRGGDEGGRQPIRSRLASLCATVSLPRLNSSEMVAVTRHRLLRSVAKHPMFSGVKDLKGTLQMLATAMVQTCQLLTKALGKLIDHVTSQLARDPSRGDVSVHLLHSAVPDVYTLIRWVDRLSLFAPEVSQGKGASKVVSVPDAFVHSGLGVLSASMQLGAARGLTVKALAKVTAKHGLSSPYLAALAKSSGNAYSDAMIPLGDSNVVLGVVQQSWLDALRGRGGRDHDRSMRRELSDPFGSPTMRREDSSETPLDTKDTTTPEGGRLCVIPMSVYASTLASAVGHANTLYSPLHTPLVQPFLSQAAWCDTALEGSKVFAVAGVASGPHLRHCVTSLYAARGCTVVQPPAGPTAVASTLTQALSSISDALAEASESEREDDSPLRETVILLSPAVLSSAADTWLGCLSSLLDNPSNISSLVSPYEISRLLKGMVEREGGAGGEAERERARERLFETFGQTVRYAIEMDTRQCALLASYPAVERHLSMVAIPVSDAEWSRGAGSSEVLEALTPAAPVPSSVMSPSTRATPAVTSSAETLAVFGDMVQTLRDKHANGGLSDVQSPFLEGQTVLYAYSAATKLVESKKDSLAAESSTLGKGLRQLKQCESTISHMRKGLSVERGKLSTAQRDATEALTNIQQAMQDVSVKQAEAKALRTTLDADTVAIETRRAEADRDYSQVKPMLEKAKLAVSQIPPRALQEVRGFSSPPHLVQVVLGAVLRLCGQKDLSWTGMRAFLAKSGFQKRLMELNIKTVHPKVIHAVKGIIQNSPEAFNEDRIRSVSKAAAPLSGWVSANIAYHGAYLKIAPLENELKQLTVSLESAQERLARVDSDLASMEKKTESLKREFEEKTQLAVTLEADLAKTEQRLGRGSALLQSLSTERVRWGDRLAATGKVLSALPQLSCAYGLAMVCAKGEVGRDSVYAALGVARSDVSELLLGDSVSDVSAGARESIALINLLFGTKAVESDDDDEVDDSAASTESSLPPPRAFFVVDPLSTAAATIACTLPNDTDTVPASSQSLVSAMHVATRFGRTLCVTGVAHPLPPVIASYLAASLEREEGGGSVGCVLAPGRPTAAIHPGFRLFLFGTSPLPASTPLPMTIPISFVPTCDSVASVYVNRCLSVWDAKVLADDLALERQTLSMRGEMRGIERQLLSVLNEADGDIIDNETVYNTLTAAKDKGLKIEAARQQVQKSRHRIQVKRVQLQPLGSACGRAVQVLSQLSSLDPLYTSGEWLVTTLFDSVLAASPVPGAEDDLSASAHALSAALYKAMHGALFHSVRACDRPTLNTLLLGGLSPERCPSSLLRWLGGVRVDIGEMASSMGISIPTCLQAADAETTLSLMACLSSTERQALTEYSGRTLSPDSLSATFGDSLSPLALAAVHTLLRPTELATALLSHCAASIRVPVSPALSVPTLVSLSSAQRPVLFVGTPPTDAIVAHASTHKIPVTDVLAEGDGQGVVSALSSVGLETPCYILLRSMHFVPRLLQELTDRLSAFNVHPDTRVFVSVSPTAALPQALVTNCVRVVVGVEGSLTDCLSDMETCTNPESAVFTLMHSMLSLRSTLRPRGVAKTPRWQREREVIGRFMDPSSSSSSHSLAVLEGVLRDGLYVSSTEDAADAALVRVVCRLAGLSLECQENDQPLPPCVASPFAMCECLFNCASATSQALSAGVPVPDAVGAILPGEGIGVLGLDRDALLMRGKESALQLRAGLAGISVDASGGASSSNASTGGDSSSRFSIVARIASGIESTVPIVQQSIDAASSKSSDPFIAAVAGEMAHAMQCLEAAKADVTALTTAEKHLSDGRVDAVTPYLEGVLHMLNSSVVPEAWTGGMPSAPVSVQDKDRAFPVTRAPGGDPLSYLTFLQNACSALSYAISATPFDLTHIARPALFVSACRRWASRQCGAPVDRITPVLVTSDVVDQNRSLYGKMPSLRVKGGCVMLQGAAWSGVELELLDGEAAKERGSVSRALPDLTLVFRPSPPASAPSYPKSELYPAHIEAEPGCVLIPLYVGTDREYPVSGMPYVSVPVTDRILGMYTYTNVSVCRKRVAGMVGHSSVLPDQCPLEPSHALDEVIARYLLRSFLLGPADTLTKEAHLSISPKYRSLFNTLAGLFDSLSANDPNPTLTWLREIGQANGPAAFAIEQHYYLRTLMERDMPKALAFARDRLAPFAPMFPDRVAELSGLLLYVGNSDLPPAKYRSILATDPLESAVCALRALAIHRLKLSPESSLSQLLRAGYSALPSLESVWPILNDVSGPCPCDVARPREYHQAFVCPVTSEVIHAPGSAVALNCGHVVSEAAFRHMSEGVSYRRVCAYCPKELIQSECTTFTLPVVDMHTSTYPVPSDHTCATHQCECQGDTQMDNTEREERGVAGETGQMAVEVSEDIR
ncbi:dynein heavy chain [Kipferlia bialata]|uniref:Dynein heavy chain n=1 Tax=Kipferlia bialata TaxID=797122 RepID=A0A9K3CNR7_9EUKA|nr:dynein heavy chain [Kipferlia bialata]|eukprot:g1332.t1